MALKRKYRTEDLVLLFTILFTFFYPFLVTGIIIIREEEKKREALYLFREALSLLTENCTENVPRLLLLSESLRAEDFYRLCRNLEGQKAEGEHFEFLRGGALYEVQLQEGRIRLVGAWRGESFKILFAEYVKGN